jgi:tetratricopeptide (TPR) repeat protein
MVFKGEDFMKSKHNRMRSIVFGIFIGTMVWLGAEQTAKGQDFDAMYNDQDAATNHINRGLAKLGVENLYGARKEFEFVIGMEKDTGKKHVAYLNRGVIFALEDRLDAAVKDYLMAIQLKPDYAEAYFNLGAVYYRQKLSKKAEEVFLKAIEIEPEYGRAHYSLGFLYLDQKKYDLAKLHAEKAAENGVPFRTLKERLAKVGQ